MKRSSTGLRHRKLPNGVLTSNFTFLNNDWPELYETAREAEQNVNSAPRISCFYARRSLERAVKWLYANDSYLKQPYADNLAALIHEPTFRENLEPCLFPKILTIQKSATWPSTAINEQ